MRRVPEPELMDGPDQARAYAAADFSEPNELFLSLFREQFPEPVGPARVLDLGCGPADILLRFARTYPETLCDALDGSAAMLVFAQRTLTAAPDLAPRVSLLQETLPSERLPARSYGVILSNSLLHHLHDPGVLWDTVLHAGRSGAAVLVMDLMRPGSEEAVDALVSQYAADAPPVLRRDFRASLCAAFTPEEVRGQLGRAGLGGLRVERVSDRHLAVRGRLD